MSSHFKARRPRRPMHAHQSGLWSGLETLESRSYMSASPVELHAAMDVTSTLGNIAQMHSLQGAISELDEVNLFAFDVEAGQKYTFDIDSDGSFDSYLRVFDATGKQIASNNNGNDFGEAKSPDSFKAVNFKTEGRYYVGISGAGNTRYDVNTSQGLKEAKSLGQYELNITNITPADTAGKNLAEALHLGVLDGDMQIEEFVGQSDKVDYIRFTLTGDAAFTLSLSDLTGDADVRLIHDANFNNKIARNEVIATSATRGSADETIEADLSAGTYYIEVKRKAGDTYYTLNLSAELAQVAAVTPQNNPAPQQQPAPTPAPSPAPAPQVVSDWFSQNLGDAGIISLSRSLFVDGSLSRGDVMMILRVAGDDDGVVDVTELTDLRVIVSNASTLGITDDVRVLAAKVTFNHSANAKYQGGNLGNLAAGSSEAQLYKLVDKWFLGTDRANATIYGSTFQYQLAKGSLFVNGPQLTDIEQGYVGDCYLLATLGSVAMIDPQAITDMFISNGDGTFAVRFFHSGVADYVTVDSYLPTDSSGRLIFAGMGNQASSTSNELWVSLAEKAYAQLNEAGWIGQNGTNSYAGIEGGWMEPVYEQVLGTNANSQYKPSQSFLSNAFQSGQMITLGSNGSTSNGVIAGHAYVLKNYNASTGTFDLYNPWGVQHITGMSFAQLQNNFSWAAVA